MNPRTVVRYICIEGSLWPSGIPISTYIDFSRTVEALTQKRIIWRDRDRRPRVGYGLVGYLRTRNEEIYLVPKHLHVSDFERWSVGITRFLSLCSTLNSSDVVISGPGIFRGSNVLRSWWADYYSRVLRQALNSTPFLWYEAYEDCLPYLRGRIIWPKQIHEFARCSPLLACHFRRYQTDHVLNRLLKWAAIHFGHLSGSPVVRARLGSCIEALRNVASQPPERSALNRIRIPASHGVYREPYVIAKSLYRSMFPTLAPGDIPGSGFVVDIVRAFESFVEGLVRRAVKVGRAQGHDWKCASQNQELLARPADGNWGSFYTRPDNVVWEIESTRGKRGIVIDAKYKGLATSPQAYKRPVGSDFYQVVVACISRGWNRALIIAPATESNEAWKPITWIVQMPDACRPIYVSMLKVDLGRLTIPGEVHENIERMVRFLESSLSACKHAEDMAG